MDKTQTSIVYDLILDDTNQRLVELRVTVVCKNRPQGGAETAVVFRTVYRFSREDQVERIDVPAEAAPLLR